MVLKLANLRYDINIVFAMIAVGFIVLFINIKAAVIGYGILAFCTIGIIFMLFALLSQGQLKESVFEMVKNIIFNSTPIIVILVILAWLITMNVTHYDRITSNAVPSDFISFLNVANTLLIAQFVCLYYYVTDRLTITKNTVEGNSVLNKATQMMSSYSTMILYLFASLTIVILGICHIIIKYYATDG